MHECATPAGGRGAAPGSHGWLLLPIAGGLPWEQDPTPDTHCFRAQWVPFPSVASALMIGKYANGKIFTLTPSSAMRTGTGMRFPGQ